MKARIAFIKLHKDQYPINFMCKVLKINRSTIYKQTTLKPKEHELINSIQNIFVKHKSCYGYRRLKIAIEKEIGIVINHKKLLKIMKNNLIFSNWSKWIHAKNKKRNYQTLKQAPFNLLQRDFKTNKQNEKWVTDITYIRIPYQRKYLYLSTLLLIYIIVKSLLIKLAKKIILNWLLKH